MRGIKRESLQKASTVTPEKCVRTMCSTCDKINQLKEHYEDKYNLLDLQNKCIQGNCSSYTISDYILRSRELSSAQDKITKTELHIITNELRQYDFTPIASLAIAVNIEKGTKYIYYIPSSSVRDFNKLKSLVKKFIKREHDALRAIDEWIRLKVSRTHHIDKILETELNGIPVVEILNNYSEVLDESLTQLISDSYNKFLSRNKTVLVCEDIFNWLNGKQLTNSSKLFIKEIININKTLSSITTKSYKLSRLHTAFLLIETLFCFSEWFIGDEELGYSEITDLLNKLFKDERNEIEQLRSWIVAESSNMAGVSQKNDEEIEALINNNLLYIDLSKNANLIPCYSFCLYLGEKYDDISIAWYTCHVDSGIRSKGVPDNQITIHTNTMDSNITNEEVVLFMKTYARILYCTPNALETLQRCNCELMLNALNRE